MPKITALRQTERRDRILDAAERCFARYGFQGATIAQICADAGVSAGGAYLYFKSKEDLIAGITERDRERIAEDFAMLEKAPDFIGALDALANHYFVDEPAHRRIMFLEIAAEASRNPAVATQWRRVDTLIQETFKQAMEAQIRAGRIKPRHDVATVAKLLMAIGDGICQRIVLDRDFNDRSAVVAMMDVVRLLLGADEAPRPGPKSKEDANAARRGDEAAVDHEELSRTS